MAEETTDTMTAPPKTEASKDEILGSLLKTMGKPAVAPAVAKKEQPSKVDPPKEQPKEAPAVAKVDPPKEQPKNNKEENLGNLRQKIEEAERIRAEREKELADLRAEYEESKKKPNVPKEYEERLTAAEQRAKDLDNHLRVVDLARHPEFQERYDKPIRGAIDQVKAALLEAGVPENEAVMALSTWDRSKFDQWEPEMTPSVRRKFTAGLTKAEELDGQRTNELKEAGATLKKMEEQHRSQQEKAKGDYLSALKTDRDAVLEELGKTDADFSKDDALKGEVLALLNRAAAIDGNALSSRDIMKSLAGAHVLSRHFERVHKEREDLKAEVEKLKAEVESRDSAIKNLNGSIPGIAPKITQPNTTTDDIVSKLMRPTVRVG